jgi:hypothetical protein
MRNLKRILLGVFILLLVLVVPGVCAGESAVDFADIPGLGQSTSISFAGHGFSFADWHVGWPDTVLGSGALLKSCAQAPRLNGGGET